MRSSSMSVMTIFAAHGPMRSIISSAPATIAVSALSRLEGIVMVPEVFPSFQSTITSMRPMRPER